MDSLAPPFQGLLHYVHAGDFPAPFDQFDAPEVWGAAFGLALFSTALAYILYFRVLATAGATNLLIVTFLIPISAILLGTAILGEQLEPKHLIGISLIGLGLAVIDGRPFGILRRALLPNRSQVLSILKEPLDRGD